MHINYFYIRRLRLFPNSGVGYKKNSSAYYHIRLRRFFLAALLFEKMRRLFLFASRSSGQAVLEFVFFVLFLMVFISGVSFTHLIFQGSSEVNLVARSRIMARMSSQKFEIIHEPESGRQERVDNSIGYRDEEREERDREYVVNDSNEADTSHMAVIKLEDPEQTLEQRIYAKTYVGFGRIDVQENSPQNMSLDPARLLKEPKDIEEFMQSEFTSAAEGYKGNL